MHRIGRGLGAHGRVVISSKVQTIGTVSASVTRVSRKAVFTCGKHRILCFDSFAILLLGNFKLPYDV